MLRLSMEPGTLSSKWRGEKASVNKIEIMEIGLFAYIEAIVQFLFYMSL